jgi:transposase
MPPRPKLAAAVSQKIEDLLRTNLSVPEVYEALNHKVSQKHVYRLARRLENFGTIRPAPLCQQGRPRTITPEAQEGIVEFLLEYDKQATVDEVRIFIEEEYDITASKKTIERAIRQAQFTRKVVS